MVIRSALGALAAVAIIGGLAAALPEREPAKPASASGTVPYGGLTKPEFQPAKDEEGSKAQGSPNPASVIRQIAYPVSQDEQAAKIAAPNPPVAAVTMPPPASPPASAAPAAPLTAPAPPVAMVERSPAPASSGSAGPEALPSAAAKPRLINLNTAAASDFDHLAGLGRIGRSIVHRRPYGAVDDLLRKRVLRAGAFARIRGLVTVD